MSYWVLLLLAAPADSGDHFEMKVRPVLAKNCYSCHTQTKLGGLRLDSREALLKGGQSGPAAIEGRPDESLLIQALEHTHARLKMPPAGKLPTEEIQLLREWVRDGLKWPASPVVPKTDGYVISAEQRAFWSFQPVRKPELPAVQDSAWPRSGIDRFILAKLEERKLKPAPPADKRTLLRRVTVDLTGLPPTADEYAAFLADDSPEAFAAVVDRLLASPAYGERWGRHWLDVARYADDRLNSTQDEPYANAYRYRDWVIEAINADMPYDVFLKAQIAGDQLPSDDPMKYRAGLGFFALSPEFQDERVDALSRGFFGLTVACAQCHDHKFDPIPTKDYYALQGVFASSETTETPLAPDTVVERYKAEKKEVDSQSERIRRFYDQQGDQVGEMLAARTKAYLLAAKGFAPSGGLDPEPLERWRKYLAQQRREHPFLKTWDELAARNASQGEFTEEAARLEVLVLALIDEKRKVDKENEIRLGLDPSRSDLANASLVSMERDRYIFWRDLFARGTKDSAGFFTSEDGIYYFGRGKIERFFQGPWKTYLDEQNAKLEALKKELPEQYPFLHTLKDKAKPADIPILIRGERNNKGAVAPRAFLTVLAKDAPKPFTQGSGRLELAEAVTNPSNPLTARVAVNRIWQEHFGRGIVNTPGNFGQLGERPTHPGLLDFLASRFIELNWSMKRLHREIVLSATYQLSASGIKANEEIDPANTMFWRANRRRMDAETIRDSMLFVSGGLESAAGGKPQKLDEKNHRRTVYGQISRRKVDPYLSLFDFPNPNATSEKRLPTNIPPQRLFFMNSEFVGAQAKALSERLQGSQAERINQAYAILYGRKPDERELALAIKFLETRPWPEYARVLLSSNEFLFVD